MTTKLDYLSAMKAESIPVGSSGLWSITKHVIKRDRLTTRNWQVVTLPAGTYTYLRCLTDATIYNNPAANW